MAQWDPEKVVDEALAIELIGDQFPALAINEISVLGAGWDNTAYLINREFVFRFPRRQIAVPLLQREMLALPLIAQAVELTVPNVIYAGKPSPKFEWPFAGYRYMHGETACRLNLNDVERESFAEPLALFLRQLHCLSVPGLEPDTFGKLDLQKRLPQLRNFLHDFEKKEVQIPYERWHAFVDQLERSQPRSDALNVVHGDFYQRHILVDENKRLSGVIDWGDAQLNSPAVDLSILFTFLPPSAHDAFIKTYGTIDDTTLMLAQMRSLSYGFILHEYAIAQNDDLMLAEALRMLGAN